ncbi:MAG: hypothetical protein V3T05_14575 [Myxococcota bacterium]
MKGARQAIYVATVVATAVMPASCRRDTYDLEGYAYDDGRCVDGYVCNPVRSVCAPELAVGCTGDAICPSTTAVGDPCEVSGTFVPCFDDVSDCSSGCRTCGHDQGWGECEGCILGADRHCSSCTDDCTNLDKVVSASCVTTAGDSACDITACVSGWLNADDDPIDGCELLCTPTGAETCNGADDDCSGVVDDITGVNLNTECNGLFVDAGEVEQWTCDDNCAIGTCTANNHDLNGDLTDGCEYACTITGAEICNGSDDDCDGSADNLTQAEIAAECAGSNPLATHVQRWDCVGGCTVGACDGGWSDAVGGASNGCETACIPDNPPTERCDGDDDDCDGIVDNEDAQGCSDHYRDADGDGWGSLADARCLCAPEGEYIPLGGDCDDADPVCAADCNLDSDIDGTRDCSDRCPFDELNDSDADTICGNDDNCPIDPNTNQADGDVDSVGDVCDNCVAVSNTGQANNDSDRFGDACDNCPFVANPGQGDLDGDDVGTLCDNCPAVSNPSQANRYGDAFGDACEGDCGRATFDAATFDIGKMLTVTVVDVDDVINTTPGSGNDAVTVIVTSAPGGDTESLVLSETASEGTFVGSLATEMAGAIADDSTLQVAGEGDVVTLTYVDDWCDQDTSGVEVTATSSAVLNCDPIEFQGKTFALLGTPVRRVWNHVTAGADRLLILGVAMESTESIDGSPEYNGFPMTQIMAREISGARLEIWYLVSPSLGDNPIAFDVTKKTDTVAGAISLSGVDQGAPIADSGFVAGVIDNPTVTLTTAEDNSWLVSILSYKEADRTASPQSGQTERWNEVEGNIEGAGATYGPLKPAGSATVSWSVTNTVELVLGAIAVAPNCPL